MKRRKQTTPPSQAVEDTDVWQNDYKSYKTSVKWKIRDCKWC